MKRAILILTIFLSAFEVLSQQLPAVKYDEAVLNDKPIAYWKLTDAEKVIAKDSVGAYSGIYHNVDSVKHLSPFLKDEKATVFNQNSYVSIVGEVNEKTPRAFQYDMFRNLTLEAWINPSLVKKQAWLTLFSKCGDYAFWIYCNGTDENFTPSYGFPGNEVAKGIRRSSACVMPNKWSHLVFVLNSTGPNEIYVNGACILSENGEDKASCQTPDYSDNTSLRIGGMLPKNCNLVHFFQGVIGHVSIYDKPLPKHTIEKHYFAGLAEKNQVLISGKKDEMITLESIAVREQALIQKEKALKAKEEDLLEFEKKLSAELERLKALSENKK